MSDDAALNGVRIVVALLAAAIVVALVASRTRVPYTVGLVLLGLGVGLVRPDVGIAVTPGLVLAVLLPGLVFEAAFRIDLAALRPMLIGVLFLAVPGVVVVAAIVAVVLHVTVGLALSSAFLIGAMVAATDPAAVIATFRQLNAPERLATAVEAESLLNDGTGIAVFMIALSSSGQVSLADGVVRFAFVLIGSVLVGGFAGWLAARVLRLSEDPLVELTVSVVLAYGAYLLVDGFGGSGIIATTLAGITLGNYGRQQGLSERAAGTIDEVWAFIAFLLTALIFLLIGLTIDLQSLAEELVPIGLAVLAVLAARSLTVYVLLGGAARLARPDRMSAIPLEWLHIMFWAGLRGAVSVALVLSLPEGLPDRSLIGSIVYGVVLFTLVAQGSTSEMVIAKALGSRPEDVPRGS